MYDILQFKITLLGTKPPIWRRVLVDKSTTFEHLHHIFQLSMGWTNSHLHEFEINGYRIAEPNKDLDEEFGDKSIDASTVTLDSIITDTKEKFKYTYDFGDSWEHQIVVEKFLPRDTKTKYPICIDGKLNCPPEDCGGIGGFYELLDIINNKRHPEREEMLEWLGGQYDAEYFDKDEINQQLASLDNYIKELKEWRDND
jgi:hypothetical protein